MARPPIILMADFDDPDISYRIAARRCKKYGELLALTYRVFDTDRNDWHVHFHFHRRHCVGQIAKCEWDDGAYFDEEFLRDGELMLYAHFREFSCAEDGVGEEEEEDDNDNVKEDEKNKANEEKEQNVQGHLSCVVGSENTIKEEPEQDQCYNQGHRDPAERHCTEQKSLSSYGDQVLSKKTSGHTPDKARIEWPTQELPSSGPIVVSNAVHQWEHYSPIMHRPTVSPVPKSSPNGDRHTAQHVFPSSPTTATIITINDCTSSRLLSSGIVVGRARPCVCRSPDERPLARAIITNSKHPQVRIYIPAKYSSHPVNKNGSVQIRGTEVEYVEDFARVAAGERTNAIMEAILRKNAGAMVWKSPVVWSRSEVDEEEEEEES